MKVRNIMTTDVVAVRPDTPLQEVARLLVIARQPGPRGGPWHVGRARRRRAADAWRTIPARLTARPTGPAAAWSWTATEGTG